MKEERQWDELWSVSEDLFRPRVHRYGMTEEAGSSDGSEAAVAQVFTGVAHPARIRLLQAIVATESMPNVADDLGMSRSGLQTHITRLLDADLIRRTPDDAYPYAVTPLGDLTYAFLDSYEDVVVDAVAMVDAAEQEAGDELEDVPLSEDAHKEAVQTRKWELVLDDLADELDEPINLLTDSLSD
jgi:DNA-binding MarR family transcriptional regulator